MSNYNVNYTDIETTPIPMTEGTENNTTLDIAIFGNTFLEYGQELNENVLHLLENFSCPMNAGNIIGNATPDVSTIAGSFNSLLTRPTKGQIWYNSTLKKLYYWDGTAWRPLSTKNDVAANWGVIGHGLQLPKPVSATTGYVFPYSECIWSVSPANFGGTFDYMACATDPLATVTMQYRMAGSPTLTNGVANYLIIGIRGNANNGIGFGTPVPVISTTPTATPTPTPVASGTATPSPTPSTTASQTPIPTGTAQPTPTSTRTPTPTPSQTGTQAPVVSNTPTPSVSSAGPTPTPTPSNTPSNTPSPSNTPTPSPSAIHPLNIPTYSPNSLLATGNCGINGPAGSFCVATTDLVSITVTGGVPPYTYLWQYFSGSVSFKPNNPTSSNTVFNSGGHTPTVSGGTCDSCTGTFAADNCPPTAFSGGYNATCAQVRCLVADSVGNTIYSPIFDIAFQFYNLS